MSAADFWGEPISVYTRAEAIEDGALVDVTSEMRRVFLASYASAAITLAAHAELGCDDPAELRRVVLAAVDVLDVIVLDARTRFVVSGHEAYVLAHEGDAGETCLTIMLRGED